MNRKGGEKKRKEIAEGGGSAGGKKKAKKQQQGDANVREDRKDRKGASASPSKSRVETGEGETAGPEAEASSLCSFPMRRVRRLVRGEAAAGSNTVEAAARTTNDAVFLINKASELFLQRFAQDSFSDAVGDRQKSLAYHHLSSTVCNGKRYEFLADFVPQKVKAEEALKAKALVET